jgi:hypothetical protein
MMVVMVVVMMMVSHSCPYGLSRRGSTVEVIYRRQSTMGRQSSRVLFGLMAVMVVAAG